MRPPALGLVLSGLLVAPALHAGPPAAPVAIVVGTGPVAATGPPAERVTLREAVARALRRNVSVIVAQQEVLRAEALLRQAMAGSLPALSGGLTYTRLDSDRVLPSADGDPANARVITSGNQLSGNLNLSVPLLAPARWAQWAHAREATGVARISAAEVQRQVAAATARAYLSVLTLRRNIEVLGRARDAARAHLDFAQARRAGGIGTRLDEVRAGQELAADEAQVQTARAQEVRAQEALGVLMGVDGPVDCADEGVVPAAAAAGIDQRSDVRLQAARVEAQRHVLRDTWTDYMPLLLGTFQPFYQNPPTLVQPTLGWQAQLILSVPIFDGGARYGARRERAALLLEARANLEGALLQARSEVRAAVATLQRADEALAAAQQAALLATEGLQLANLAYRAGATTNLEVIDAERRARDAETAAEAAAHASRQARLDLLIAGGKFP